MESSMVPSFLLEEFSSKLGRCWALQKLSDHDVEIK